MTRGSTRAASEAVVAAAAAAAAAGSVGCAWATGDAGVAGVAPKEPTGATGTADAVGTTGFAAPVSVEAPAAEAAGATGVAVVAAVEGAVKAPTPETGAAVELGVAGTDGVAPAGADPGDGTAGTAGAAGEAGDVGFAGMADTAGESTWAGPEPWPGSGPGAWADEPGAVGVVAIVVPSWINDRPKIEDGAVCALSAGDLTTTGTTGEAQLLGTCAPVPEIATGVAPGVPAGPGDAMRPGRLVTVCTASESRDGSNDGRIDPE
jgi:hypothetical protein